MFRSITFICLLVKLMVQRLLVSDNLPFKDVHLLLGNDLAGDKVVVNPLVTDTHCILLSRNSLIFTHHVQLLEPWQRKPC